MLHDSLNGGKKTQGKTYNIFNICKKFVQKYWVFILFLK